MLRLNKYKIILFVVLLLSIFPSIKIGAFTIPVLYLLMPIQVAIFIHVILNGIKIPKIIKTITLIFTLIIVQIFISTFYGSVVYVGSFDLPTDILQYIARYLILFSFVIVFYYNKIDQDTFIKYFLMCLIIGMFIGILQWIPTPVREFFVKLYPYKDGTVQLSQLNRQLQGIRVHGLAQHATANGGLATFCFVYGYSIFKYYFKYKKQAIILMILSIVNLFASQARAGMLALVFAICLLYVLDIFINRKKLKSILKIVFSIIGISFVVWILYKNGNVFINKMVYRWQVLFETNGGPRVEQVQYFISLMESSIQYLLGLSKTVINNSEISYGIEIEPINIFVMYGILGFLLQYGLVILLLIYFIKRINIIRKSDNKISLSLLVASFVGLFSYQVFSVGYYFFREFRIGLFPWILMGVTIAIYERQRINGGNYE